MLFWTLQTPEVLEIIEREGIYIPDFRKSENFLAKNAELFKLYMYVLQCFNQNNHVAFDGLVFSFLPTVDGRIMNCTSYSDFVTLMKQNGMTEDSAWKELAAKNCSVLCVEMPDAFNPILIHYSNFCMLIPTITLDDPYDYSYLGNLLYSMHKGILTKPLPGINSNIIQAHLPCIRKEDIRGVFPMF